ncbi:hypothetical protein SAMN05216251_1121, partial [Actinacidiphila alni]
ARDSAAQVVKPANDAIELGSPYTETDASAGLAVLTGQSSKTLAEQQAALGQAKADQAAKASAQAAALAAAADADAKAAATAAADAAASAAKALISLNKARASAAEAATAAKAAVTAEQHTVTYNQQATDDAAAAAGASTTAAGYATDARASADAAEQDAATARNAASAAETDAATARGLADQAEADATTAEQAAANAQQAAKDAQDAAADAEEEKDNKRQSDQLSSGVTNGSSGIYLSYDLDDTMSSDGFCSGTHTGDGIGCEYTVKHHVTGTIMYFVAFCPVPDTLVAECIGDLDFRYLTMATVDITHEQKEHVDGLELTESVLIAIKDAMLGHIVGCAQSPSLGDCAWAALDISPVLLGTISKIVESMRAAVAAGESLDALQAAMEAQGVGRGVASGIADGAKVSEIVAEEMGKVKEIATARGTTLSAMGKDLWGMKDGSLALRTAEHVAKVKELRYTKDEIQKIYAAYKRVDEVSPTNPSANQRWQLMQYILDNWG